MKKKAKAKAEAAKDAIEITEEDILKHVPLVVDDEIQKLEDQEASLKKKLQSRGRDLSESSRQTTPRSRSRSATGADHPSRTPSVSDGAPRDAIVEKDVDIAASDFASAPAAASRATGKKNKVDGAARGTRSRARLRGEGAQSAVVPSRATLATLSVTPPTSTPDPGPSTPSASADRARASDANGDTSNIHGDPVPDSARFPATTLPMLDPSTPTDPLPVQTPFQAATRTFVGGLLGAQAPVRTVATQHHVTTGHVEACEQRPMPRDVCAQVRSRPAMRSSVGVYTGNTSDRLATEHVEACEQRQTPPDVCAQGGDRSVLDASDPNFDAGFGTEARARPPGGLGSQFYREALEEMQSPSYNSKDPLAVSKTFSELRQKILSHCQNIRPEIVAAFPVNVAAAKLAAARKRDVSEEEGVSDTALAPATLLPIAETQGAVQMRSDGQAIDGDVWSEQQLKSLWDACAKFKSIANNHWHHVAKCVPGKVQPIFATLSGGTSECEKYSISRHNT